MGLIQRLFPGPKLTAEVENLKKHIATLEQKAIPVRAPLDFVYNSVNNSFISAPIFQDVKKYIDEGFNLNSTVYSIINTSSEKFSSIPWLLYRVKNNAKALQYRAMTQAYNDSPEYLRKMMLLKNQAFDEITDSDVMKVWDNPNTTQSGSEFRAAALMFKMLTGAAPIWGNMGGSGVKLQEIEVLPTQYIQIYPNESLTGIARMTYNITGAMIPLDLDNVLYWKYNNPNFDITGQHLYGQAPLRAAQIEVSADNENVLAQRFMFEHAGVAGLWTPKNINDAGTLSASPTLVSDLRETLSDVHNRNEPGTDSKPFANFPMDYTSYGMDSKEMDLVQSRRLSKEFIANIFNFPIPLLSSEASTYNNVDAAVKYLSTNTIYANLCSYRDRMANGWYLKKFKDSSKYFIDFDISMLPELQGDYQKMVDSLSKMDWLTMDEKREATKYDAKGGAYDTAYIPSSMVPIELAGDMGDIPNNGTY